MATEPIMSRFLNRYAVGAVALCAAMSATAGIQVGGTRVVYDGARREASISVKNTESKPYVVQAWMDNGDERSGRNVPFSITPPIFRLDGGKESLLRIQYAGQGLPGDRESVLWLNVQEIPPAPEKENVLQIAMRTRIKLFYRPKGLQGEPAQSASQLRWQVQQVQGEATLVVDNPTPYSVSLGTVTMLGQQIDGQMVLPKTKLSLPLPAEAKVLAGGQYDVSYTYINDYGATSQPLKARTSAAVEHAVSAASSAGAVAQ